MANGAGPLAAAMCICMPWNVMRTTEALESPIDWFLFNSQLVGSLRRICKRNADVLSTNFDVDDILKVGKMMIGDKEN